MVAYILSMLMVALPAGSIEEIINANDRYLSGIQGIDYSATIKSNDMRYIHTVRRHAFMENNIKLEVLRDVSKSTGIYSKHPSVTVYCVNSSYGFNVAEKEGKKIVKTISKSKEDILYRMDFEFELSALSPIYFRGRFLKDWLKTNGFTLSSPVLENGKSKYSINYHNDGKSIDDKDVSFKGTLTLNDLYLIESANVEVTFRSERGVAVRPYELRIQYENTFNGMRVPSYISHRYLVSNDFQSKSFKNFTISNDTLRKAVAEEFTLSHYGFQEPFATQNNASITTYTLWHMVFTLAGAVLIILAIIMIRRRSTIV